MMIKYIHFMYYLNFTTNTNRLGHSRLLVSHLYKCFMLNVRLLCESNKIEVNGPISLHLCLCGL